MKDANDYIKSINNVIFETVAVDARKLMEKLEEQEFKTEKLQNGKIKITLHIANKDF